LFFGTIARFGVDFFENYRPLKKLPKPVRLWKFFVLTGRCVIVINQNGLVLETKYYGKPKVFTRNTAIWARVTGFSGQ